MCIVALSISWRAAGARGAFFMLTLDRPSTFLLCVIPFRCKYIRSDLSRVRVQAEDIIPPGSNSHSFNLVRYIYH